MSTQRQRILVTGASGFLGAGLVRRLIAAGQDVHVVVRPGPLSPRLAGLAGRLTVHQADLRDGPAVARAVAACRPEVIYHLAAHGTFCTQKDRAAILASNVLGTAHLLDALEGQDYQALVHAGSSSEYGHKAGPLCETDPLRPRGAYGVGKAAATLLCQAEALRGRPAVTVRIFSAYGPWEDPSRLISYIMGCCLRGELPRLTAGDSPRDFIYADDVLDLLELASRHPAAPAGQVLHAGTGIQQTVRSVVETVLAVCGARVTAEFGTRAPRPDEPTHWVASIEQTTALTGWRPRHSLESGVRLMWEWFVGQARAA